MLQLIITWKNYCTSGYVFVLRQLNSFIDHYTRKSNPSIIHTLPGDKAKPDY